MKIKNRIKCNEIKKNNIVSLLFNIKGIKFYKNNFDINIIVEQIKIHENNINKNIFDKFIFINSSDEDLDDDININYIINSEKYIQKKIKENIDFNKI